MEQSFNHIPSASPGILDELRRGKVDFDIQPVYPTYAGDVASVLHLLVEHLLQGGELRGIYHFQGPDQLSELQIAKLWCQVRGLTRGDAAELDGRFVRGWGCWGLGCFGCEPFGVAGAPLVGRFLVLTHKLTQLLIQYTVVTAKTDDS